MKKNNLKINNQKKLYSLLIIINSVTFTYYTGLRGVFPIDSFLIFNSGYNIINDFHPFKAYWSITGPFLDYLQYIIFSLFGINWASYIFHAALINTLLALISFHFFNQLGLKITYSALYSLSISILAYPSAGTPFIDHHATILSLISLIYLILAIKKKNKLYWFLVPIFIGVSFFSKQIPIAYLSIYFAFIILIFFYLNNSKNYNFLNYFFGGMIIFSFFILCLIFFKDIPIKNIIDQYFYYPISIGSTRIKSIDFNFNNVFSQFKFIYFSISPIFISLFYLLKKNFKSLDEKNDILILFLALGSAIIFLYTQIITKNQILIFFLIPFYLGVSNFFLNNYFKKRIVINFILLLLIISTFKYHLRFNVERKFMELNYVNFDFAIDSSQLDYRLKGLKWISPDFDKPELELQLLKDIKNQIIQDNIRKIIVSDYQILSTITDIKNLAPNKWFDELSVPSKNNVFFDSYKNFFNESLIKQKIKIVYVIGIEKLDYIIRILPNPNCIKKEEINKISFKIDISNCYN